MNSNSSIMTDLIHAQLNNIFNNNYVDTIQGKSAGKNHLKRSKEIFGNQNECLSEEKKWFPGGA